MKNTPTLSLKKFVISEITNDMWLKACALNELIPYQQTVLQKMRINRELRRLRAEIKGKSPKELEAIILQWEQEILS